MKTTLKQLAEQFKDYAGSEENTPALRQLAAQLALLTAHVGRVELDNKKAQKAFDSQLAELAQHVLDIRDGASSAAPAAAPQQRPVQAQPVQASEQVADSSSEEEDVDSMIRKIQQDNAAEDAALMAKHQKTNGQAEASS